MSIKHIYEGWRNHLLPPGAMKELITKVSDERLEICRACPFHSSNKVGYETMRIDEHCTKCGCPLIAKTKSLSSSCPVNKWGPELTPEEEQTIPDDEKNIQG